MNDDRHTDRNADGTFKPGISGNPQGRPKTIEEVVDAAREHTLEAIGTLVELMRKADKDGTRLRAASLLLERGWGQPAKPLIVAGEEVEDRKLELVFIPSRPKAAA
jgi:Family of unknown function (DUF5681)